MKKLLFYLALTIIAISLFALTIGQWLPVEFADMKTQFTFYDILFYAFPLQTPITRYYNRDKLIIPYHKSNPVNRHPVNGISPSSK